MPVVCSASTLFNLSNVMKPERNLSRLLNRAFAQDPTLGKMQARDPRGLKLEPRKIDLLVGKAQLGMLDHAGLGRWAAAARLGCEQLIMMRGVYALPPFMVIMPAWMMHGDDDAHEVEGANTVHGTRGGDCSTTGSGSDDDKDRVTKSSKERYSYLVVGS